MDERSVTIRPKERPAVFMRACARSPRYTIPYFFVTANLKTQRKYRARLASFSSFSESAGFGGVLSIPLISKGANSWAGRAKPTEKEMNVVRVSCEFASEAIVELRRRAAMARLENHQLFALVSGWGACFHSRKHRVCTSIFLSDCG